MTDARGDLGRAGEAAAAEHLGSRGLEILERNYRCRAGEVDLVAVEGGVLVFVEVKTRSGRGYGLPAEAVTPAKQRRLRQVASQYLQERRPPQQDLRFDVVEVLGRPGSFHLQHLRGAF